MLHNPIKSINFAQIEKIFCKCSYSAIPPLSCSYEPTFVTSTMSKFDSFKKLITFTYFQFSKLWVQSLPMTWLLTWPSTLFHSLSLLSLILASLDKHSSYHKKAVLRRRSPYFILAIWQDILNSHNSYSTRKRALLFSYSLRELFLLFCALTNIPNKMSQGNWKKTALNRRTKFGQSQRSIIFVVCNACARVPYLWRWKFLVQ